MEDNYDIYSLGSNKANINIRTLKRDGVCNCCTRIIHKDIDEVITFTNRKPPYNDIILCKQCASNLVIPDYDVIDIIKDLRRNIDEAEQFEGYIDNFIRNCSREALVFTAKLLAESVKDNMETPYLQENLNDTVEDLEKLLKKVEELE